ncbi:hypothetical protein D9611_007913 [Ephemerocybe angulata]|uniref:FAD/NAD(P)-binding domain-containing protein n=1 Tax=Ephemerocybe angulata TaxID=980116 RepID=A0A8H5CEZ2_9AGAR|nr:hypothetical protein D9611_007913 [Tulosesus angulatus]
MTLVIKSLSAKLDASKHRLVLITPRPEYVNLIGSLRLVTDPSTSYDDVFMPYTKVFGNFPGKIIVGSATSIEETKIEIARIRSRSAGDLLGPGQGVGSANVSVAGGDVILDTGERVPYDVIILATGSIWEGIVAFPNKPGEYVEHVESWRRKIRAAQKIVIVGGGPVGIETAGEIKDTYPSKEVTIVQGDRLLLNDVYPDKFRVSVQRKLESQGVEIILDDAVKGNPHCLSRPIKTREGRELTCDLLNADGYMCHQITARGGGANTNYLKFLKPTPLTDRGYVKVLSTLEVLYHPGMFALGDIVDLPEVKQLAKISLGHADVVVKNVLQYLNGEMTTHSYRGSTDYMAICVGKGGGVSFLGLWWGFVFGDFFTRYMKSRTLLVEQVRDTLGLS